MNDARFFKKGTCLGFLALSLVLGSLVLSAQEPSSKVLWESDPEMHDYFVDRFLESPGFGFARTGEAPMSIRDTMRLRITQGASVETFKLISFDLIGIARHTPPVAFVSRARRHDTPGASPATRQLTVFEQMAVTELNSGKATSVQMNGEGRLVVGALRARQECLQCHAGYKTGDLLGALAYRLAPIP